MCAVYFIRIGPKYTCYAKIKAGLLIEITKRIRSFTVERNSMRKKKPATKFMV